MSVLGNISSDKLTVVISRLLGFCIIAKFHFLVFFLIKNCHQKIMFIFSRCAQMFTFPNQEHRFRFEPSTEQCQLKICKNIFPK